MSVGKRKTALISGITGQDGAYLSRLLLDKGYEVHGIKRRSSLSNTGRIDDLLDKAQGKLKLHHGDVTDGMSVTRIVQDVQPDEIYNLAAQSHVHVSFETPEYTANADALGALRFLEAIRILGLTQKTRFHQASTSEMYGEVSETPQNELTPFRPRSPYAAAKLYAYWMCVNYREAYGIHASNGILFNHESPLRGENFVTRKITKAAVAIARGEQECLYLGNLDAKRDWGHARDYMDAVWRIVQQDTPDDFVIATGRSHTVRQFVEMVFKRLNIQLEWRGQGTEEVGVDVSSGREIIRVDPAFFRPADVETLQGDASKAKVILGWEPTTSLETLVEEMVEHDSHISNRQNGNVGRGDVPCRRSV